LIVITFRVNIPDLSKDAVQTEAHEKLEIVLNVMKMTLNRFPCFHSAEILTAVQSLITKVDGRAPVSLCLFNTRYGDERIFRNSSTACNRYRMRHISKAPLESKLQSSSLRYHTYVVPVPSLD